MKIAAAAKQYGLTLVKTVDGYSLVKLGEIVANNVESKE
jgi:hypothetical protein